MVYATLAGTLLHALSLPDDDAPAAIAFRLRWHGMTEATREVAGQYGPVLLSGVVASGGLLVDQSMAAMLPAGSVSALALCQPLCQRGAHPAGRSDFHGRRALLLAHDRRRATGPGAGTLSAPGSGITALVSVPIARLPDCRRPSAGPPHLPTWRLRPPDTIVVSPVLAMYAIQIPFFVMQPGLLPVYRGHAAHRIYCFIAASQFGPRYCC